MSDLAKQLADAKAQGYKEGIADGEKEHEEFCKVCIHKVSKSDIDALQETAIKDYITWLHESHKIDRRTWDILDDLADEYINK